MIHVYLYVVNLSVEVSLQVYPPLFVKELMKEHRCEGNLSNSIRIVTIFKISTMGSAICHQVIVKTLAWT